MKMNSSLQRNLFLTLFLCLAFGITSYSQIRVKAQIGGSNFLGGSLDTEYDIALSESGKHTLTPTIGVGGLLPKWDQPTMLIHLGLNYRYAGWGVGCEMSGFTLSPFSVPQGNRDFPDIIVYPNINYTVFTKRNPSLFFSISAGAYLAYSKNYYGVEPSFYYEGDPIPGLGISVGYRF
ncbi:MAG: hypothetical protein SchgKO_19580 [Schleiferiaceae bacterium]